MSGGFCPVIVQVPRTRRAGGKITPTVDIFDLIHNMTNNLFLKNKG